MHQVAGTMEERRRIAKRAPAYQWQDGQLVRKLLDGSTRRVPPPAERPDIIRRTHELAGHFGTKRTMHLLTQQYYWPHIKADVAAVLGACETCKRSNPTALAVNPTMHSLPIKGLGYRWGVDLFKLPPSAAEYSRVLVAVEHLSRYVVLAPMVDKAAGTVALAFKQGVLAYFGSMAEVVSDNGTEFQGEFAELLTAYHIDHRKTSPYHPQANGLTERVVQTMKAALRKLCADDPAVREEWEERLAELQLAYNATPQASTKLSPMMVMMAQAPVVPPAVRPRIEAPVEWDHPGDGWRSAAAVARAAELLERAEILKRAGIVAARNLAIAQHKDTLRYARRHGGGYKPQALQFEVGQYVYTSRKGRDVLDPTRNPGVLRVKELRGTGVAVLEGRDGATVERHVSTLAPCH